MPVSMNLIGMQAESMVVAAMNKGQNFNRAATAFFRTANVEKQEGNAVVALHSVVRNMSESGDLVHSEKKARNIYTVLIDAIETAKKSCKVLEEEADKFEATLNVNYHDTLGVRVSLSQFGAVRPDKVHRSKISERIIAGMRNLVRTE